MDTRVTVAILAAGLGTRMKSRKAKVLHQAGGKTLIEHTVETALELAPPERVFVVVGHQSDEVQRTVAGHGVGLIHQREQKGTGHALMIGRNSLAQLGGLLVVYYGDCPLIPASVLQAMVESQEKTHAAATIVTADLDDPTGYGRVIRDAAGHVRTVVEQRDGTPEQLAIREANVGIYCFRADVFWKHVDELQPNNPAREYYLTDMVEVLIRAGHTIDACRAQDPLQLLGIDNRSELVAADRASRERKVHELLLAGVAVHKLATYPVDDTALSGLY